MERSSRLAFESKGIEVVEAYLGLGSNLGDRAGHLKAAMELIESTEGIGIVEKSSLYRTAPVGGIEQDPYFNAVVRVETSLEPLELLDRCLAIERMRGRERLERWGPRTLDIDLLLYGARLARDSRLELPHPEMAKRSFVLVPLVEISPEAKIGYRVATECLETLGSDGTEKLLSFDMCQTVAIVGASPKPERYSYRAQCMLESHGHSVVPTHPLERTIQGVPAVKSLAEFDGQLDTVTLYVGPARQGAIVEDLVQARPKRVIFNPGTENAESMDVLRNAGVDTIEACTLVMLQTGQFSLSRQ